MKNFAVTGVAGFVAPRHLEAIRATGHRLIAAVDPHDAVGVLDRYGFDVRFFTEPERFDRHLEKLRLGPAELRSHGDFLGEFADDRAFAQVRDFAFCLEPLTSHALTSSDLPCSRSN